MSKQGVPNRDGDVECGRRLFLQAGAVISALPLVGGAVSWPSAAAAEGVPIPFYKIFFDDAQPAAAAFGRSARAAGHRVQPIGADVTALWSSDLRHLWRDNPAPIAGLTTESAAYCLEVFGRDAGMRTLFRALHEPVQGGGFAHTVCTPDARRIKSPLLGQQADWGARLAELLVSDRSLQATSGAIPLDYAPHLGLAPPRRLVSWVIAPGARA